MSETLLIKKLGIKSGMFLSFVNMPDEFGDLLGKIPEDIVFIEPAQGKKADYIHAFYHNKEELIHDILYLKKNLQKDGMLWISWPKGSSGVDTDLNWDSIREMVIQEGLVDVKVCSINEIWSALKFVYRLKDR